MLLPIVCSKMLLLLMAGCKHDPLTSSTSLALAECKIDDWIAVYWQVDDWVCWLFD